MPVVPRGVPHLTLTPAHAPSQAPIELSSAQAPGRAGRSGTRQEGKLQLHARKHIQDTGAQERKSQEGDGVDKKTPARRISAY